MSPGEAVALFSIGVLVAVLAFLAFETYNAVVALRLRIDKAWANIDVALKQRHDMLPALVSAVRGLMQFEQDVLVDVTRARATPHRTDPRPGGGVGRDDIGGPFAVRRRRAVPEHSVSGQRPRPAERDRADRGPDRRPTRALQRPGLPVQRAHRASPGAAVGPDLPMAAAQFFIAMPEETARPDTGSGRA